MTSSRVVAALAATVLAATACTPGSSPEPRQGPAPGGALRVSVRELTSLDPARSAGRGALTAVAAMFEPLVRYDASSGLKPALAERWSPNADGSVWRFVLRDAVFSDGTPVTATDVKFGLDRIARRSVRADAAFLLERVRGFRDARVTGRAQGLSGVGVISPKIVEFRLDRPFFEFPYLLAHPALVPLPAARYAKAKALPEMPVGNGPYRATEFDSGVEARLVRNDRYKGATVFLDEISIRVARSTEDGWRAFTAGEVDLAEMPDGVLDPNPSQDGGTGPLWATLYLGLNLNNRRYATPEVRRAMSSAIDRKALVAGVYDGEQEVGGAIVPPGVRGAPSSPCAACVHDLAAARKVLVPKKMSARIDHLDDPRSRRLGALVVEQLKRAGVKATSKAYKREAYEELLRREQHDIAQLGYPVDVASPDGPLSQQLLSGSVNNQVNLKDPTFDRLVTQARGTKAEDARLDLYRRAEARALSLMPLVPLVTFQNRSAVAAHVRGLVLDGIGVFDARAVWLARI